MDSLGSWSMRGVVGSEAEARRPIFDEGRLWCFEYELSGAVSGAGRRVMTWTDGESLRADDGTTLLVEGKQGLVVRAAGSEPQVVRQGSGELYSPPFPEVEGLRSLRQACAWVDAPLPRSAPVATIVLGRDAWQYTAPSLRVVVDAELDSVLELEHVGDRGPMRLAGLSCGWVSPWPEAFSDDLLPSSL